ncbi:hypothetical protein [Martelella sp. HB161492]|uniref:hypothetical protein n=1 Tax=Martelella sp. HB161492 TaxID=2720726 RepID=UPI001590349E|nr:hypothetical protein [Martelella sp. HB161492]
MMHVLFSGFLTVRIAEATGKAQRPVGRFVPESLILAPDLKIITPEEMHNIFERFRT